MAKGIRSTRSGISYAVVPGSAGSFGDAPGSPTHRYEVIGYTNNKDNPCAIMSLTAALDDEDVPAPIKGQVRTLFAVAKQRPSEAWVRHTYGYFKNCYSPDGTNRNVSDCVIDKTNELPATHHLGYLAVRAQFPDHEPRLDLIASGGNYGTRECSKCGQRVQYEAKYDDWAVFGQTLTCPKGGRHDVDRPEDDTNPEAVNQ